MNRYQKMLKLVDHSISISSNEIANALRAKLLEPEPKFSLVQAKRHRSTWGTVEECEDDIHREDALRTYSGCIDIAVNTKEEITLYVYDGDNYDGHRTHIRGTYDLTGPWWTVKDLAAEMERTWKRHTLQILAKQEAELLEVRRSALANILLDSI